MHKMGRRGLGGEGFVFRNVNEEGIRIMEMQHSGSKVVPRTRSVPYFLFAIFIVISTFVILLSNHSFTVKQMDLVHHPGKGEMIPDGHDLRIAVLSNYVELPQDDSHGVASFEAVRVFGEHVANKECYCKLHGYDFILDSRYHVEGMSYAGKEMNERQGITAHYNKPFLIRKWLPHYDWVLWLDMDAFVIDLQRPVESFIRSFRAVDIHVLIPQEQTNLYFFSAYALLIRNSPESRAMVEDWFLLKDECPYAKFHDQQRLYIALLRMVLNYEGEEVNHNVKSQTDCMPYCVSEQSAKYMSYCFGDVLRLRGYRVMPNLKPPLAISNHPWEFPRKKNLNDASQESGLGLQGTFGPIFSDVSLIDNAFVVHIKPMRYDSLPSPSFIAARLHSHYTNGMKKCWGEEGWFADPVSTLKAIAQNNPRGHDSDMETEYNSITPVPARNERYTSTLTEALRGSKRRVFGMNGDSLACIAASPASGANTFAEIVLLPMIEQRLSDKEKNKGCDIVVQGRHRACSVESQFSSYWPHMLFKHANDDLHDNNHQFSKWRFTFLRHPLDRILISYLLLKSSLSRGGDSYDNNNENPQLDMMCTDSSFVALNNRHNNNNKGNDDEFQNNRLLSSELTLNDYFKIDVNGYGRNVYSKFYLKQWDSTHKWGGDNNNKQCEGSPYSMLPHWSNDDGEKHNQWMQGHQAAGALLDYHFYGIFEHWNASIELLTLTLGGSGSSSLPPLQFPTKETALLKELKTEMLLTHLETLKKDAEVVELARKHSPVDFIMYDEAQKEFKQRCNALGIIINI